VGPHRQRSRYRLEDRDAIFGVLAEKII
jgi:hypothetical protein